MAPRRGHESDPLRDVELVLVDGNNLLGSSRLPAGAVIGPIRAAIPSGVRVELVFDGPPRGVTGRLATGFSVRYSGRSTADALILDVVARQAREHGPAGTWSILVVSDDRQLRDAAHAAGARSAGATWLAGRIGSHGPAGDGHGRSGGAGQAGGGWAHAGRPRNPGGASGSGRTNGPRAGSSDPSTPARGFPGRGPSATSRPRNGTTIGNGRPPRRPNDGAC